jgi:leucyl-tRNA synthetase
MTIVVQVNGKVRDRVEVAASASEDEIRSLALASQKVSAFLDGRRLHKVIYVPGRLVNLVG